MSAQRPERSIKTYMPSLDGLRGLAILLIIPHNAQMLDVPHPDAAVSLAAYLLNVGWFGVLLFFVLSGYLITGILLDSRHRPGALRSFVARRALRTFPLYWGTLLVMLVVLPALGLLPDLYKPQLDHQLFLWTYLANWTEALGIGPATMPHVWSLCVEEQFYLIWPFVVWGITSSRKLAAVCLALALLSVLTRAWLVDQGMVEAAYRWTISRLDGLTLGALAAILWRSEEARAWIDRHARLLMIAAAMVLLFGFLYAKGFPRTGMRSMTVGYVSLAIFFTACVYACARQDVLGGSGMAPRWHRALTWGPLCSIGKYSYGMFLFHKILHDSFSARAVKALGIQTQGHIFNATLHVVAVIAASYALAWLSYNLYEIHFLKLKRFFVPGAMSPAKA